MAGLTRRAVVLAKIQSAQGAAAVPSPLLNAILVSDMTFRTNGTPIERNFLRDSLSRIPHRMGRILFEANFSFELKAGPALGARPEWSPLLRAGGYQENITAVATSIRTAALRWIASAVGTDVFYVELLAGGDPALANPSVVREGGQDMTRGGSIAALKAGQFAYGDADNLGFNTVYVRLTDGADPDTKALAYVEHVAGTKIDYDLRDTAHEFATVCLYPDGLEIQCVDAVVDWSITFNAGQIATVQCRVQSNYARPTDVPIPAVVNYQSHLPPICESMGFTVGGFAAGVLPNLSINGGNQIVPREDLNSPDGLKSMRYAGRSLQGNVTIEQELAATFNFFEKFDQATEMVALAALGSSPQRVSMSWPNVQFGQIQSADLQGLRGYTIPLMFNEDLATSAKEQKITLD